MIVFVGGDDGVGGGTCHMHVPTGDMMDNDDVARMELIARRAACADDVAWRMGYTDVRHRVARSGGIRSHGTVIDVDCYHVTGNRRYTIDVTTYAGNGTSLGRGRVIR